MNLIKIMSDHHSGNMKEANKIATAIREALVERVERIMRCCLVEQYGEDVSDELVKEDKDYNQALSDVITMLKEK